MLAHEWLAEVCGLYSASVQQTTQFILTDPVIRLNSHVLDYNYFRFFAIILLVWIYVF